MDDSVDGSGDMSPLDMQCGRKDRKMLKKAMNLLCQVIEQTAI